MFPINTRMAALLLQIRIGIEQHPKIFSANSTRLIH